MADSKSRQKCFKEVKLLESLSHPNIVSYLGAFIDSGTLMIVFEWAEVN